MKKVLDGKASEPIELHIRSFKKEGTITTELLEEHHLQSSEDTGFAPVGLDEPYRIVVGSNPVNRVDPLGWDSLLFNGGTLYWINDYGIMIRQYPAISGPYSKGRLEEGIYTGENLRIRTKKGMVCPSGGWSLDLNPNFATGRDNLRIHPDQPPVGTEGCIGVACSASKQLYNDLKNYFESGNFSIPIIVNYNLTYGGGNYK